LKNVPLWQTITAKNFLQNTLPLLPLEEISLAETRFANTCMARPYFGSFFEQHLLATYFFFSTLCARKTNTAAFTLLRIPFL
jgi:hypothetical protein